MGSPLPAHGVLAVAPARPVWPWAELGLPESGVGGGLQLVGVEALLGWPSVMVAEGSGGGGREAGSALAAWLDLPLPGWQASQHP